MFKRIDNDPFPIRACPAEQLQPRIILCHVCRGTAWWDVRNNRAPFWRLYWNQDSGASIILNGKRTRLEPSMVALVAPDTPFSKETHSEVSHFHLHFYAGKLLDARVRERIFVIPLSREMREVLIDIIRLLGANTLDSHFLVSCMYAISWALNRATADITPITITDQRVAGAQDFVGRNFSSQIHTRDLARRAGMNLNAFIRLFKAHVKATPQQFIAARRIEAACDLLHDPQPSIESIADQCGFCDRNYFTAVFTRLMGITPVAFRRMRDQHEKPLPMME